jgi:hypothetical protein
LESRGWNLHLAPVHPVGIPRLVSMEGHWTDSERGEEEEEEEEGGGGGGGGGGGTRRKDEQDDADDESGGRTILESTNDTILFAPLSRREGI